MKRPPGMPRWKWEQRHRASEAESADDEVRELAREHVIRLKEAGVKMVQWIRSGLPDDPKRCRDAHEKVVKLSGMRSGSHGRGCKCVLIAVEDPEPDEEIKVSPPRREAMPGETEEQRRRRILEDFSRKLW